MGRPIRVLSLFAGIGGLEIGVRLAFRRSKVVGYVERDAYACRTLLARMEESSLDPAPVFIGEVQEMDASELLGEVDVVCGGIPCQPYSVAGDQRGNEDDRALWPEFARVVAECRPSMVFIENVPTFVTGGGFRPLGEELCRLGYELADPFFIGAGDLGAPHERQRVFILAYRDFDGSEDEWGFGELDGGIWPTFWDHAHGRDQKLGDANGPRRKTAREGGQEYSGPEPETGGRGLGQGDVSDAERDQIRVEPERGFREARSSESWDTILGDMGLFPPGPDDPEWGEVIEQRPYLCPSIEPGLRVVVDGIPVALDESYADQLRCSGNAVVVAQAYVAFQWLFRQALGEGKGEF